MERQNEYEDDEDDYCRWAEGERVQSLRRRTDIFDMRGGLSEEERAIGPAAAEGGKQKQLCARADRSRRQLK